MNKKLLLLLATIPLLTSCGCSQTGKDRNRQNTDDPPVEEFDKKVSELEEKDYKLVPEYFVKRLSLYKNYVAVTKGQTVANVSILGIPIETTQSIDVTVIKGDYSYLKNESHSTLVNSVHTAYFHEDQVASTNGGDYEVTTLETYLQRYGTYPFDNAIEGYTINGDSITSITKLESETDYKFKLVFNTEVCTNNVKMQMREFGGLDDYPNISKVEITITIKDDFTPIKLDLESEYVAKLAVDSSCHQNYTVEYSKYNEVTEIPNLESIKDKFNQKS